MFNRKAVTINWTVTVPATDNVDYVLEMPQYIRRIRGQFVTKGANTTCKLQESNDGTTYNDVVTWAAGFNAVNADLLARYIKINLANAAGSGEANVVVFVVEYDMEQKYPQE